MLENGGGANGRYAIRFFLKACRQCLLVDAGVGFLKSALRLVALLLP